LPQGAVKTVGAVVVAQFAQGGDWGFIRQKLLRAVFELALFVVQDGNHRYTLYYFDSCSGRFDGLKC